MPNFKINTKLAIGRGMPPKVHAKTPPINGVFPLDTEGVCAEAAQTYVACVRAAGTSRAASACVDAARAYMDCRVSKGLMSAKDHSWASTLQQ